MLTVVLAVLVVAFASATVIGLRQQQRSLSAQVQRLEGTTAREADAAIPDQTSELPEPVARYLRWSLMHASEIRTVRLRQVGTLRADVHSERWMPFEAEHVVSPHGIGFVWNARVRIVPLLHVRVRDAYIEGEGSGQVALISAFPVSSAAGTPEMNSGSLHRFLAEAVWYPTALLPSTKLRWEAIDGNRAMATLTDDGTSVSLEFRFADTGEVTGVYTPGRWGTFGGRYEQRPWEGHFHHYVERDGVVVPTEGDVGWYVDGTWHTVWNGTITEFHAESAARPVAQ